MSTSIHLSIKHKFWWIWKPCFWTFFHILHDFTRDTLLSRPDEQNDIGPTSFVNVNKMPTLAQGMIAIWICFLCILCFTANCHVLQTVYCQMPNANCLLLTAKCPLPTVYCHVPMYCQLSTAKNKLPNAHCCCCLLLCSHLCNREDTSSHYQQPIRKQSTRSEVRLYVAIDIFGGN